MVKIIQSPDFRKKMDDTAADPIGDTPWEQMARQIKDDTERFARLVKEAKVVLEAGPARRCLRHNGPP